MLHHMLRAAAGRDRIPTDGLVVWYTMDNISGSTLVDEMGNFDGAITGATQVAGAIGQALSFDGVNDYVSVSGLQNQQVMTLSFWVKTSYNSDGFKAVFEKGSNYNSDEQAFLVGMENIPSLGGRAFYFSVKKPSGYGAKYIPLSSVNDNLYHLITIKYDSFSSDVSQILIYLDGAESSLTPGVDSPSKTNYTPVDLEMSPLYIGARAGSSFFSPVSIDQIRIYNSLLSDSEIQAIYNEGA